MKLIEDFNEMPTLGFIISTQLAIRLWNLSNVLQFIHEYLNNSPLSLDFWWGRLENQVKAMAESIVGIPSTLKEDLVAVIIPIGYHIKAMRTFLHYSPDAVNRLYFAELQVNSWTPYGTVETESFERILANDRRLTYGFRFSLACNDCFEDIIEEVFYYVRDPAMYYTEHTASNELQSYWTFRMIGDLSSFINVVESPFEDIVRSDYTAEELAFMYSLKKKSRAGIEYFLKHLPRPRVETICERHFSSLLAPTSEGGLLALPARLEEQRSDALYFLLSSLSENVRGNILRRNAYEVLNIFLRYPFFGLFDKFSTILVNHLREIDTLYLLVRIVHLRYLNVHLFGYQLFQNFWRICPEGYKTYVINTCTTSFFPDQELVLSAIREAEGIHAA
ncbi:hypothetical protein TNCT_179901 [Trichonephila clavata]|uniref:Uncharacterized protein n=1 Tax=Trichonephila clavata TaxID=2740835 RepID=A0A8X6IB42_TRICU|nr:hypothetical protein TNCT_179901 [Trichonephila clavata]